MCGFAGFYNKNNGMQGDAMADIVKAMSDSIVHRGPDDEGIWVDPSDGIAFGHRRLAILDLSEAGHQPMHSACGRYVVVFNGEIYNYRLLREGLEKSDPEICWKGHSDTEVMLALFTVWGVVETLKKLVGMFAIAVWDKERRALMLARDRFGEKPLYYGWSGSKFVFGSELKVFRECPEFEAKVDRNSLALFFRHNYIPTPFSIWEGVSKLIPGTCLTLCIDSQEQEIEEFWSVSNVARHGIENPFAGTPDHAVDKLEALLSEAISGQMISDVPLGAFLSGGIDSSTVVALMQAQASMPVRTFSIGFHEQGYDEAAHAKAVAKHLKTEHTEFYVTAADATSVIPKLPSLYDEPFSDSSQIPTLVLSELTRQHVTVSLSGDGGDELFCGYNRYEWVKVLWKKLQRVPMPVRLVIYRFVTRFSPDQWDRVFNTLILLVPKQYRYESFGDKLHKLVELFSVKSAEEIYLHLVSHWKTPEDVVLGSREPLTALTDCSRWLTSDSLEQRMMYLDQQTYMRDDILVKVDRAGMGVSLETRVPMLDHRVAEFAWSLPLNYKVREGQLKWPLRQVLYRHVPRELIDRPKMGFGIPIAEWLRGSLREWAETLLDPQRLRQEGYLKPEPIHRKWREHQSGNRNWGYYLWDVLMFQAWLEHEGLN